MNSVQALMIITNYCKNVHLFSYKKVTYFKTIFILQKFAERKGGDTTFASLPLHQLSLSFALRNSNFGEIRLGIQICYL